MFQPDEPVVEDEDDDDDDEEEDEDDDKDEEDTEGSIRTQMWILLILFSSSPCFLANMCDLSVCDNN